ncbi:MAG: glutathione S-transferase family protein [Beijerinckiaceae bacterium]|jgi:glutathione S-transferase|nr:glutathione S-transferase family protein [Beijerinckiaceae bacterium]
MLKLNVFGTALGLADPSPFCAKAIMLLKIAGLEYEAITADVRKTPKAKLPVLEDNGEIIADSTFIRLHLEQKYNIDFDKGLTDEQKAVAWSVEKMCEDHLYWIIMHERWADDTNFRNGPAKFFDILPAPVRPIIKSMVRRQIRKSLHAHGMGRHSKDEMAILGARAIASIAAILGDKPYFLGSEPCGVDATVYAFLTSCACPVFDSRLREAMAQHPNLTAYARRMTQQYLPELAKPH